MNTLKAWCDTNSGTILEGKERYFSWSVMQDDKHTSHIEVNIHYLSVHDGEKTVGADLIGSVIGHYDFLDELCALAVKEAQMWLTTADWKLFDQKEQDVLQA